MRSTEGNPGVSIQNESHSQGKVEKNESVVSPPSHRDNIEQNLKIKTEEFCLALMPQLSEDEILLRKFTPGKSNRKVSTCSVYNKQYKTPAG